MRSEWSLKGTGNGRFLFLCICVSLLVGIITRVPLFVSSDFPLGDGALFTTMIEAIRSNGYILPHTVSYNHETIPFAYPPLGLYFGAIVSDIFGAGALDVVRIVPLLCNFLTIIAFVLLADRLLSDKVSLLVGSLIFPAIPKSYEWVIIGGGITRSVGFLFTVLALYWICRFEKERSRANFIACLICLSAAVATHLEWGISASTAVSLYVLSVSKNFRRSLITLFILGIGAAILTAPWWGTVVSRFGLAPFLAAGKTSYWSFSSFINLVGTFKIFSLFVGDILPWFVLCGWLVGLYKRNWFLSLWLPAIYLTTPRHSGTIATVPLALLIAVGMRFVEGYLRSTIQAWAENGHGKALNRALGQAPLILVWVPYLLGAFVVGDMIVKNLVDPPVPILTKNQRLMMETIRKETAPEARFIVIAGYPWSKNVVAEWFPLLSERKSLTTVQGQEWVAAPGFMYARSRHETMVELVQMERRGLLSNALVKFTEAVFEDFDYVMVFVHKPRSGFGGFLESGRYNMIYHDEEILVLKKIDSQPAETK